MKYQLKVYGDEYLVVAVVDLKSEPSQYNIGEQAQARAGERLLIDLGRYEKVNVTFGVLPDVVVVVLHVDTDRKISIMVEDVRSFGHGLLAGKEQRWKIDSGQIVFFVVDQHHVVDACAQLERKVVEAVENEILDVAVARRRGHRG